MSWEKVTPFSGTRGGILTCHPILTAGPELGVVFWGIWNTPSQGVLPEHLFKIRPLLVVFYAFSDYQKQIPASIYLYITRWYFVITSLFNCIVITVCSMLNCLIIEVFIFRQGMSIGNLNKKINYLQLNFGKVKRRNKPKTNLDNVKRIF